MRGWGRSLRPLVIALSSCVVGCAGLLGIDDDYCRRGTVGCGGVTNALREPDASTDAAAPDGGRSSSSPVDASAPDAQPPRASSEALCARYCQGIADKCTGENVAYLQEECAALCPHFPRLPEAGAVNSLECRLSVVEGPVLEPRTDCPGAGRGGDSVCGSNCESYCHLMEVICPVSFEETFQNDEACQSFCQQELDDPGGFDAVGAERGAPSTVQCRLWHLGAAAALGFQDNGRTGNIHCRHARGADICVLPDAGAP